MPENIIITQGMFLKMKHISMAYILENGPCDVLCVSNVPTVTQKVIKNYLKTEIPSLHLPFHCSVDGNFRKTCGGIRTCLAPYSK